MQSGGEKLHRLDDLMAAVTAFASRAGEKLRAQRLRVSTTRKARLPR